jgi:hypothetical protein
VSIFSCIKLKLDTSDTGLGVSMDCFEQAVMIKKAPKIIVTFFNKLFCMDISVDEFYLEMLSCKWFKYRHLRDFSPLNYITILTKILGKILF